MFNLGMVFSNKRNVIVRTLLLLASLVLIASCDINPEPEYIYTASVMSASAKTASFTVLHNNGHTSIDVPSTVTIDGTEYTVTRFLGFSDEEVAGEVVSVSLPNTVNSISSTAFAGAYSLRSVTVRSSLLSGKEWLIITNCTIPREGYTFLGWYCDGHKLTTHDTVTDYRYAQPRWEQIPAATVTLMVDGEEYDTIEYTYGTGSSLPGRDQITKDGYHFAGWYGDSDFCGEKIESITAQDRGDRTLYAKFEEHTFVRTGTFPEETHTCSVCGVSHQATWTQGVCQEGSHSIATCGGQYCDIIVNEESTGTVVLNSGTFELNVELKDAPCGEMKIERMAGQDKWTIKFVPHQNSEAVVFASCFVGGVALQADENMVFTFQPSANGRYRYSFSAVSGSGQAIEKVGYIEIEL